MAWERLVRFVSAQDDQIKYGEPITTPGSVDLLRTVEASELQVRVLDGEDLWLLKETEKIETAKSLLCPLSAEDVPIVRCIGLNYKSHILETGRPLPTCPTIFYKPGPSIAGPNDTIPIPRIAQSQCDYEGELAIVIGKAAKDVAEEDALSYIAGYAVANDVSARDWQREADKAGPIPQWCFSKSFDKYAPIGPCIVSAAVLGLADNLELSTTVNGQLRQKGSTADLCFGAAKLVAFCSQGQTLQRGSVILTGTPGGVGLFMKPPQFLKDGDVVEVEISGIGRIRNRMGFL